MLINGLSEKKWLKAKVMLFVCKKISCLAVIVLLLKNLPPSFDSFTETPSRGASGGILTVWRPDILRGTLVEVKPFSIVIIFASVHNNDKWFLVNVYGPCKGEMRDQFVRWMYALDIEADHN